MIGDLTEVLVNELLHKEIVGRIGCYANGMVYVVPISYAFDGNSIYAHTYEGLKIDMMRQNPEVCFEVDDFRDMADWKSVIAWGIFEEIILKDERENALKLLGNRRLPVVASSTTKLSEGWPFDTKYEVIDGIIFRIALKKRTGKYERSADTLNR